MPHGRRRQYWSTYSWEGLLLFAKVYRHLKRYNPYSIYAAKSELKGEVSSSYLTWIWWILDPVLFMLVYVFITVVVFRSSG